VLEFPVLIALPGLGLWQLPNHLGNKQTPSYGKTIQIDTELKGYLLDLLPDIQAVHGILSLLDLSGQRISVAIELAPHTALRSIINRYSLEDI
jgi:hypothetical protein